VFDGLIRRENILPGVTAGASANVQSLKIGTGKETVPPVAAAWIVT
jgi:hypothetical protein